jgi:hypothetical protein
MIRVMTRTINREAAVGGVERREKLTTRSCLPSRAGGGAGQAVRWRGVEHGKVDQPVTLGTEGGSVVK